MDNRQPFIRWEFGCLGTLTLKSRKLENVGNVTLGSRSVGEAEVSVVSVVYVEDRGLSVYVLFCFR